MHLYPSLMAEWGYSMAGYHSGRAKLLWPGLRAYRAGHQTLLSKASLLSLQL